MTIMSPFKRVTARDHSLLEQTLIMSSCWPMNFSYEVVMGFCANLVTRFGIMIYFSYSFSVQFDSFWWSWFFFRLQKCFIILYIYQNYLFIMHSTFLELKHNSKAMICFLHKLNRNKVAKSKLFILLYTICLMIKYMITCYIL